MADDILLTQEEQDEKAKQWLKDNGVALVVGIALGLGGIFGFNAYKDSKQANAEEASSLYSFVMDQVTTSNTINIDEPVNSLKTDHVGTPYAAKAVLIKAGQLAKTDVPASLVEYQWVIDNAKEVGLRHTAKIRKAKLYVSLSEYDKAKEIASQEPYDNFASHYNEILGDVAVGQAELEMAYGYYQQATEQLLPGDASYASVLQLKMAPLPKPEEEVIDSLVSKIEAESAVLQKTESSSVFEAEGSLLPEAESSSSILNESSKQSLETELSTDNDSIETVVESVKDVMQETDVAPLVEEVVE